MILCMISLEIEILQIKVALSFEDFLKFCFEFKAENFFGILWSYGSCVTCER